MIANRVAAVARNTLGCLTYRAEALAEAADFNRTGERQVSFEFPGWVVRRGVRDCFRRHALRGWAFEPILVAGTPAFDAYLDLWKSLFAAPSQGPGFTLRSGRPWADGALP